MGFFTWIVAGAALGWGACALFGIRDRGHLVLNVATGIGGVLAAGWLLGKVIGSSAFEPGEFRVESLLVSLLAAALLLAVPLFFAQSRRETARDGMNAPSGIWRAVRPLITAGIAGVLMLVGACASTPTAPDSALDGARVAISNAEKAEAGRYAGPELGEARDKLALADNAVRDEDMVAAERFAQESRVQAELASARTAAAKARSVNEEMERGADALAEEMKRAGEPR